jgi:heme/copper-type cytochrome/quinol oxidase subunit 2
VVESAVRGCQGSHWQAPAGARAAVARHERNTVNRGIIATIIGVLVIIILVIVILRLT